MIETLVVERPGVPRGTEEICLERAGKPSRKAKEALSEEISQRQAEVVIISNLVQFTVLCLQYIGTKRYMYIFSPERAKPASSLGDEDLTLWELFAPLLGKVNLD